MPPGAMNTTPSVVAFYVTLADVGLRQRAVTAVAKFSKSRVSDKVTEGIPLFLRYPNFLKHCAVEGYVSP